MKPGWQPAPLHCQKCKHDWDDWMPTNVPAAIWPGRRTWVPNRIQRSRRSPCHADVLLELANG